MSKPQVSEQAVRAQGAWPRVLVLTPVKDASPYLERYFDCSAG